jgi:aminobenzoyl-glutamate utilization protein B
MTRTTMYESINSDVYEVLPNRPLSEILDRQLQRVGPPNFTEAERAFARQTQAELADAPAEALASALRPLPDTPALTPASTDVGNISWNVPTGRLTVASYTLGAPGHSWQIVACTGMSIGEKGMLVAARTLAGAALELLADPSKVDAARVDFSTRHAAGPIPESLLAPDQSAPAVIR